MHKKAIPQLIQPIPLASSLFPLDTLVRLSSHQRAEPSSDADIGVPSDSCSSDSWCSCRTRMDGGHQACHQFRQRGRILGVSPMNSPQYLALNPPYTSLYNNIIPPSQLPQKANYYLFKVTILPFASFVRGIDDIIQEGIIPAWEDEANKNGGKWSIQLPKDKNRANVDKMWLYTVRSPDIFPLVYCFIYDI